MSETTAAAIDANEDRGVGGWVRTWGASPQSPDSGIGSLVTQPPFADVTLRQVVRISGGGSRVRIRFTNEFGTVPLTIGAAQVGVATPDGGVEPGSALALTFAGRASVTVPIGAPILSDPIDVSLPALTRLSISLYLPERVETCTCHDPSLDTGWMIPGNSVEVPTLPEKAEPLPVRALISAVEVIPESPAKTVVVLGDSLADGFGSTPDLHHTWPELLAGRLGATGYVSNQGISGNRLLNDGLGTSGMARFDRDVLTTPGLGHVVVSLGRNDISISFAPRDDTDAADGFLAMFPGGPVAVEDIIAGYGQLIARAHDRGVKIYVATVTPDKGSDTYTPEGEKARQAVNTWIRASGAFDGVLDFDAVWRDPARPSRIVENLQAGDYLHGSDAGYQALADSIDLSLFH